MTRTPNGHFMLTWKEIATALALCVGSIIISVAFVVNAYANMTTEARHMRQEMAEMREEQKHDRDERADMSLALQKAITNQQFILKMLDRHDEDIRALKEK